MRTVLLTVFWLALLFGLPMWIGQNYPMPEGEASVIVVAWWLSLAVMGAMAYEKGYKKGRGER